MDYISRQIESKLYETLQRSKSVLLLGPRQTGKTTLIQRLKANKIISLVNLNDRLRYAKNLALLCHEVEAIAQTNQGLPLVIIDEVQKIPILMDSIQDLIDRKVAKFVITGSSARKYDAAAMSIY